MELSFQAGLVKTEEIPAFSQQTPVTVCFSWWHQYAYQHFSKILRHPHQVRKYINIMYSWSHQTYITLILLGWSHFITSAFVKCPLCESPKTQPEPHSPHSCAGWICYYPVFFWASLSFLKSGPLISYSTWYFEFHTPQNHLFTNT